MTKTHCHGGSDYSVSAEGEAQQLHHQSWRREGAKGPTPLETVMTADSGLSVLRDFQDQSGTKVAVRTFCNDARLGVVAPRDLGYLGSRRDDGRR
jgi:hypothetical protein